MKKNHKLRACLSLCTILLLACSPTAWEPVSGDSPADEGILHVTHAQVLTGIAQTRAALTYENGDIWIEAYDQTCRCKLNSDGRLTDQSIALIMPRTSKRAEGLVAYGEVVSVAYGSLPFHAIATSHPVNWNTSNEDNHVATLTGPISLTSAVAALHITLKDAEGTTLNGFNIIAQEIYNFASPGGLLNSWEKDSNGTYQIKPDKTRLAEGSEETDFFAVPTTLTPGTAMLSITGGNGSGVYQGKTWTANVPDGLPKLEQGKRYSLTVILNGERVGISVSNINDWTEGTAGYVPKGYDYAIYTWQDLEEVLSLGSGIQDKNIIQMADITWPDDKEWKTNNLPSGCLYNGNGHTVTGLNAPLFDGVQGNVYNLHLRGSKVTANSSCGLLANSNVGTITLCSATGILTKTALGYVGGLVGINDHQGYINRSYTNCQVITDDISATICAGGLVGYNEHVITACAAFGTVEKKKVNNNIKTGTVVGYNSNEVQYSYAIANGDPIGAGSITIETSNNVDASTLVTDPVDPTIINVEKRTFIKDDFWKAGNPPEIDFTYEGIEE